MPHGIHSFIGFCRRPHNLLWVSALALLIVHIAWQPDRYRQLSPVNVQRLTVTMAIRAGGEDVEVRAFIPQSGYRQQVLEHSVQSDGLNYRMSQTPAGLQGVWLGNSLTGRRQISFSADLLLEPLNYRIDPRLTVPASYPPHLAHHRRATATIQSGHPAVARLWQTLAPAGDGSVRGTLAAIHRHVSESVETANFQQGVDAVTALNLARAGAVGKSRLFVALARHAGLAARPVGGVVMKEGRHQSTHQWVEVRIGEHWVPFDPTDDHFAALPADYVRLYRGDRALFQSTPASGFDHEFVMDTHPMAAGVQAAMASPHSADRLNPMTLLALLGLDEQTASIFLLFPLAALCIAFCRNVVGINAFGTFTPMLVAAACRYMGLGLGLLTFAAVLLLAFAVHRGLERWRLLKIPRLAAVITVVTLFFLMIVALLNQLGIQLQLGIIVLFPVVIVAFAAEKLHQVVADEDWRQLTGQCIGSIVLVIVCYGIFSSVVLRGLFAVYPQLILAVLAGILFLGQWTGIRVSELWRFFRLIKEPRGMLLGLNARNRDLVLGKNPRDLQRLANHKLLTKAVLNEYGIPTPRTLKEYHAQTDFFHLEADLQGDEASRGFVIKPARSSRGQGIWVIRRDHAGAWVSAHGRRVTVGDIHHHLQEILQGGFAPDHQPDVAFVEERLVEHESLGRLSPFGLSDIRVLLHNGQPMLAMWRIPTLQSGGKANLHQGAVGVAVDIHTGKTHRAQLNGRAVRRHPDSSERLLGYQLPHWPQVLKLARQCYAAVPLGFLGVDVAIDRDRGPLVLEINARAGLEIQNIKGRGMADLFATVPAGVTS